jgi:thioredoxin-like negative regulator of GroEL
MNSTFGIKKLLETNSDYILAGIVIVILLILLLCYSNTSYTNNAPTNRESYTNDYDVPQNLNYMQDVRVNEQQNNSPQLVLFYTNWCGYSRQFLPIWEECKKVFNAKYPNLALVDIECSDKDARCQGIRGFPTVKFFKDGQIEEFMGPRTVQGIEQFIAGRV